MGKLLQTKGIQSAMPEGFFTARMARRGYRLRRSDVMGHQSHQINALFNRMPDFCIMEIDFKLGCNTD
jgi:hypothetical protein